MPFRLRNRTKKNSGLSIGGVDTVDSRPSPGKKSQSDLNVSSSTTGSMANQSYLSTISNKERKQEKLLESMNLVGQKIQEYRDLLMNHESILSNAEPDTLMLEAVVRRYYREVQIVDAIRSKESRILSLQTYHRYAMGLREFIRKPNLDPCFKQNPKEEAKIKKAETETQTEEIEGAAAVIVQEDKLILPPPPPSEENEIDSKSIPSSVESETNFPPPPDRDEAVSTNKCEEVSHNDPVVKIDSETCTEAEYEQKDVADGACCSDMIIPNIRKRRESLVQAKLTRLTNGRFIVDPEEDIVDATLNMYRYSVFKPKGYRQRSRLDNIFPIVQHDQDSTVLHQDFHYSRNRQSCGEDNNILAAGDSEDVSPWANKSKSANESWYEARERFTTQKERESLTSLKLNRHSSSIYVHSPPSKTSLLQGSPFTKDNIKGHTERRSLTHTSSCSTVKSPNVRFRDFRNVSPIPPSPSRKATYIPSDESSSEEGDNLHFEVEQFPCVDSGIRRLRRNLGKYNLQN